MRRWQAVRRLGAKWAGSSPPGNASESLLGFRKGDLGVQPALSGVPGWSKRRGRGVTRVSEIYRARPTLVEVAAAGAQVAASAWLQTAKGSDRLSPFVPLCLAQLGIC